jgi:hypothetical protein
MFLNKSNPNKWNTLGLWYKEFGLLAFIADVLSLVICVIATEYCYNKVFDEYTLIKFIALAIVIQNTHDYLFYKINLSIPRGRSRIMDFFKDYADENGTDILIADSIMVTSTILIANLFKNYDLETSINILIVSFYTVPYLIGTI